MRDIRVGLVPWFRPRPIKVVTYVNGLPPADAPARLKAREADLRTCEASASTENSAGSVAPESAGSSEITARRGRGRPFPKGVSGNPRGRPKSAKQPAANSSETAAPR
jgi:hypothetical protein